MHHFEYNALYEADSSEGLLVFSASVVKGGLTGGGAGAGRGNVAGGERCTSLTYQSRGMYITLTYQSFAGGGIPVVRRVGSAGPVRQTGVGGVI